MGQTNDPENIFTKLELGALMIAQGFIANPEPFKHTEGLSLVRASVKLAKAVLEEVKQTSK